MQPTVILYNPISTSPGKQRLPMSLLSIASMLTDRYAVKLIDGNLTENPAQEIIDRVKATNSKLLGVTVMPGPQLRQAVPVCKTVKQACPDLTIVWGGYFPSNHYETVLKSDFVDYVVISQGEVAFRELVDFVHDGGDVKDVPSLAYKNGDVHLTPRAPIAPLNNMPMYPYDILDMQQYVGTSYLGNRVLAHHTSWGCPFACNFCAIVPLARRQWSAESPKRVAETMQMMKDRWQIDGMEFHDMDFFVKEDRSVEIADRMSGMDINWWALGRADTLMSYSDESFEILSKSGVKMIFMGAESGDDEILKMMNKGGKSGTDKTLGIAERMQKYGIVPEFSFVLGTPPDPIASIEKTIQFIKLVKEVNPASELILYMYTPTPQENSTLLQEAESLGFSFPQTLEEWAGDDWAEKSLRRNPGTPWSQDPVRKKIRDFETVINAYYPTVTDMRLKGTMRHLLKTLSGWRYKMDFYVHPYELKVLQRLIQYRRPETMGF